MHTYLYLISIYYVCLQWVCIHIYCIHVCISTVYAVSYRYIYYIRIEYQINTQFIDMKRLIQQTLIYFYIYKKNTISL